MGRRPDLIRALMVIFVLGLAVTGLTTAWHSRQHQDNQVKAATPIHNRQVVASVVHSSFDPRD